MRVFNNLAELSTCVGQEVALSDWVTVTQAQVQLFADATGDQQWIHTDPVRAASGPFGAPIAHGFLTLSLLPQLSELSMRVASVRMGVNYGLNRVRFMSPVPVGANLRARFKLLSSEPVAPSGAQLVWEVSFELEGVAKPACVAESVVRQFE